jgi:hypothetical protein
VVSARREGGVIAAIGGSSWQRARPQSNDETEDRSSMRTADDIETARVEFRESVRSKRDALSKREAEIAELPHYARPPDAERVLYAARTQLVEDVRGSASKLYAQSAKALERVEAEHAKAIEQSDSAVNARRAGELADALRGRIALVEQSITGEDSRLRALSKAIDEAITTLDPDRLRAVWMVGSDLVDRGDSPEPGLARSLKRQLARIAAEERRDVDLAEAEVRAAQSARAELRREILATGEQLTGGSSAIPGSGWARDVLGERLNGFSGEIETIEAVA